MFEPSFNKKFNKKKMFLLIINLVGLFAKCLTLNVCLNYK